MIFNFIGNYSVIISLFLTFAIFFRTIFRLKNLNELIKENKKFELKFNHLEKNKYTEAYKQRTNQALVSSNAAQNI